MAPLSSIFPSLTGVARNFQCLASLGDAALSPFYLFLVFLLSFLTHADPTKKKFQTRIIESKPKTELNPRFITFPIVPLSHFEFEALVSSLLRTRQKSTTGTR